MEERAMTWFIYIAKICTQPLSVGGMHFLAQPQVGDRGKVQSVLKRGEDQRQKNLF